MCVSATGAQKVGFSRPAFFPRSFSKMLISPLWSADTVTEFSWEPRGERFAIVSTSDPNAANPGPGITIKTNVSFYQLERGKGDFKLLSKCCQYLTDCFICVSEL